MLCHGFGHNSTICHRARHVKIVSTNSEANPNQLS